ncbi:MAG: hypothetical protein AB7G23_20960 [Vicinamibacterales bacterium]
MTDSLRVDARDLAAALTEGRGGDGLDVVFGGAYPDPPDLARLLRAAADVLDPAPSGTLSNVAVSEIRPGQEWLLEGGWVRVVEVEVKHPDDRVTIVYEQDGEQEITREYRGFEEAAVRWPSRSRPPA